MLMVMKIHFCIPGFFVQLSVQFIHTLGMLKWTGVYLAKILVNIYS